MSQVGCPLRCTHQQGPDWIGISDDFTIQLLENYSFTWIPPLFDTIHFFVHILIYLNCFVQ